MLFFILLFRRMDTPKQVSRKVVVEHDIELLEMLNNKTINLTSWIFYFLFFVTSYRNFCQLKWIELSNAEIKVAATDLDGIAPKLGLIEKKERERKKKQRI